MVCLAWIALGQGLSGCQGAPAKPGEIDPQPAQPELPKPLSAQDQLQVRQLLARAQDALAADHLTYPAKGSAITLFDAVRAIDPDNADAQRGLDTIVERYVDMSERAASQGQLARARSMLDRARIVDPDHPAIEPNERRLKLLNNAEHERLRIDAQQLRGKNAGLITALKSIGVKARAEHCRAIIRVGSDAQGRWVYQQMSSGPGERRIRAQVQIGTPPQVEVLCFQPPQ